MKEILVSQPAYVTRFSCIGAACRDHCCKRWEITLDKTTYNKYLKSEIPNIRKIAQEHIKVGKKSFQHWANMSLDSEGNCFYLNEQRLCEVHKQLGADALSYTCTIYPRVNQVYKNEELKSLNMSCPEASKQILFSPDALLNQTSSYIKDSYHSQPAADSEGRLINLFCANLMLVPQPRVEHNIYAIIYFILAAEKAQGTLDNKLQSMEAAYQAITLQMQNGQLAASLQNINEMQTLELQLLMNLQKHILIIKGLRGQAKLVSYMITLNEFFPGGLSEQQLSTNLSRLKSAWDEIALPWLNQRPYILRNFFQYRLYHDQFGIKRTGSLLKDLYLIMADYFFIKSMLSATALVKGELTDDDIIDVMYSYSTFRQHEMTAQQNFSDEIDLCKRGDDLSVVRLLV
ncbi:flagellar protein FliB [Rahnella sp. SAP-1]|uniref:Flagellar protein FliB n=1 Tax=Rouxiella aceris TaxID=2703884 RepID=A0A848MPT4_9GAMM|nr:flagellin lysine-N-methylase [Rouxiella aceris]NMP28104.1 flagellar protein FliB [Rouxiella aceris]